MKKLTYHGSTEIIKKPEKEKYIMIMDSLAFN